MAQALRYQSEIAMSGGVSNDVNTVAVVGTLFADACNKSCIGSRAFFNDIISLGAPPND